MLQKVPPMIQLEFITDPDVRDAILAAHDAGAYQTVHQIALDYGVGICAKCLALTTRDATVVHDAIRKTDARHLTCRACSGVTVRASLMRVRALSGTTLNSRMQELSAHDRTMTANDRKIPSVPVRNLMPALDESRTKPPSRWYHAPGKLVRRLLRREA